MRGLANRMLDRPVAVGVACGVVFALGLVCFPLIPIDIGEEASAPQLVVNVSWPGASALTIESRLTAPLESLVRGVRGVTRLRSTTGEGSAYVAAEFTRSTDISRAELELNERIYAFFRERPEGVSWPVVRRSAPSLRRELRGFFVCYVHGQEDPSVLRRLVQERVRLPLLAIPGVKAVSVHGGGEPGVLIEMDKSVARGRGIDMKRLSVALAARGMQTRSLDANETHGALSSIQIVGGFENLDAIRRIPLQGAGKSPRVLLGDVANVRYRYRDADVVFRINGRNAVAVRVERAYASDMIRTSRRVSDEITELSGYMPEGVEITVLNNAGAEVHAELKFLLRRSVVSIALICLVLAGVFKRFHTVVLILTSVLLSALGAFSLFFLFGLRLNLVTLAGFTIGFGVCVDNAIVVYDYVLRSVEERVSDVDLKDAVVQGLHYVMYPIAASNLTTLGAFVPVFFLSEDLQRYFQPLAVSLGLTLVFALVIALVAIPTFFYRSRRPMESADGKVDPMFRFYQGALSYCLRHRFWVLALLAWMVGFPIWLLPDEVGQSQAYAEEEYTSASKVETRKEFMNWLNERETKAASSAISRVTYEEEKSPPSSWRLLSDWAARLYNNVWGNPAVVSVKPALNLTLGGATYYLFRNAATRVQEPPNRHIMNEIKEEYSLVVFLEMPFNAHISRLDGLFKGVEKQLFSFSPFIKGIITQSSGRFGFIQILLKDEHKSSAILYPIYEHLVAYGENIGGVGYRVWGQDLDPLGKSLGGTAGVTRQLEIRGYNLRHVGDIAEGIARRLKERRSRRIRDVQIDRTYGPPRYEMLAVIDHSKTTRLGVDHAEVVDEIQTRLDEGSSVRRVSVAGQEIPAAISVSSQGQTNLHRLSQVRLDGHAARIGDVSRLEKQLTRSTIERDNQRYLKEVGFSVIGDYQYSYKVVEDVIAQERLPYGYSLRTGYAWRDFTEDKRKELALIVLLSVLLVWMITSALFESWTRPILVLFALPMALIGVGVGIYLSGASFNIGGYASLLLLMGISVNNAILLVHNISCTLQARPSSPMDAAVRAAFQRLRPIFITTLTTVAGFLPLMLHGDRADAWYTLAIGTSGGLVVSSFLLVIVVPICMVPRASLRRPASSGTGL
ncbi:MAG: efflux RND transporter permease subunit [Gemmatimonadota bacterium]|nr:efflux RND transporter permease subunit [Gemmatimonadota bacterium]